MSKDNTPPATATTEDLLKAKIAELEAENARQGDELAKAHTIIKKSNKTGQAASLPIPGVFKADFETANGKKVKKTVKFKDGSKHTRLKDGAVVDSALLLKVANGTKLSKEEAKANGVLAKMDKTAAVAEMSHLVNIGYALLEEVKN